MIRLSHPDPTLEHLQQNYVQAVDPWLRDFIVLFQSDFQARFDVCLNCPLGFRSEGRAGLGHCEHPELNCRKIKPWLAHVHCPIEAWPVMPTQFLDIPQH